METLAFYAPYVIIYSIFIIIPVLLAIFTDAIVWMGIASCIALCISILVAIHIVGNENYGIVVYFFFIMAPLGVFTVSCIISGAIKYIYQRLI